ncbi:MAG: T9SS type A sorting domain-containing protein [Bacteroidota bacterium]
MQSITFLQRQYARLQKRINRPSFLNLLVHKQQQIRRRLMRCEQRLRHVAGVAVLSMVGIATTQAQKYCFNFDPPFDRPLTVLYGAENTDPQLVDFDQDGDLDLISGGESAGLLFFQNEGNDEFILQEGSNNPFGIRSGNGISPELVDFDEDGDFDLIVGSRSGVSYLKNEGDNGFVEQSGSDNPFRNIRIDYAKPTLVDIDRDGDLDLIVGNQNGDILFYENIDDVFIPMTGSSNPFDDISVASLASPQLIDVDSDSDLDLIVGVGGRGETSGTIAYYSNDGDNNFTEQIGSGNPFEDVKVFRNATPQLVDFDQDGDLDLISGDDFGRVRYFKNLPSCLDSSIDGYVACAIDGFDELEVSGRSIPQLVDIDGDERLDLVSGDEDGTIHYFKSNEDGTFDQQSGSNDIFAGIDVDRNASPCLVDLDKDDDLDLVVGNISGQILYYQNQGSYDFLLQNSEDNPFSDINVRGNASPYLVDLDGDGNLDFISGNRGDSIVYYRNNGSNSFVRQVDEDNPFNALFLSDGNIPQVIDINGDGFLDLILGNINGRVEYYQNDGADNFIRQNGTNNPFGLVVAEEEIAVFLADIDMDGDLDLVNGNLDGRFIFYKNTDLSIITSFVKDCNNSNGLVDVTIESTQEEGTYTLGNAFSGAIGEEGQLGATSTIPINLNELGEYAIEATASDGCAQVAGIFKVESQIIDAGTLFINTCSPPFTASFETIESTIGYKIEIVLPALNNRIIERTIPTNQLEINMRLPRRLLGTEALIRIAPVCESGDGLDVGMFSQQRSFIIGCEDGSIENRDKHIDDTTLLRDEDDIDIFPNPSEGILSYEINKFENIQSISIYNTLGKLVLTTQTLNGQIDISALSSGQYIIIFEGREGTFHRLIQKL